MIGLTTAATVWVNAALGVAAGAGDYHLAMIGGSVTLAVLLILQPDRTRSRARLGGGQSEDVTDDGGQTAPTTERLS